MTTTIQTLLLTGKTPASKEAEAQREEVTDLFLAFIKAASYSLHIAIYDFRLDEPEGKEIADALAERANAGVDVRIAYFQEDPDHHHTQAAEFMASGVDPATLSAAHDWLSTTFSKSRVHLKPVMDLDLNDMPEHVAALPITGGGKLMHSKYMIRDGMTPDAHVLTGSANFTSDAWSLQDNNILILPSQDVAHAYETDFAELWHAGCIAGTGKDDQVEASIGASRVQVDFSPGDGARLDTRIALLIESAKEEVVVASMVISSPAVLHALVGAIARGIAVRGVYDGPEMHLVENDWSKHPNSAPRLAAWTTVKTHLTAKQSHAYAADAPHDFMHNKTMVVDGETVVTGSFNFSSNATHNAENQLVVDDQDIAREFVAYIDHLQEQFRKHPAHQARTHAASSH